jgi:hypothetical protein
VNYIRTARYHCATGLKCPWTEDLGTFQIRKYIYKDVNALSKILGGWLHCYAKERFTRGYQLA